MKVSTNAIRFINQHYASADDPAPNGVDDLVQKIGAQLAAVEEVIPFGQRFADVIIVKVVSCQDHPNADRLHLCKIDDGSRAQGVERDENGLVQVVCGAPNVHEGMLAAWLPPGSTVPSTLGKEPFVLEARELRGQTSNGMLASPKELAISDSHEGILEIDKDVQPGTLFVDAYHLRDDFIIDMENKMFTHRPDCFGWLGIAREIEGIYHRPYKSPEWYRLNPDIPSVETEELKLEVRNEIPQLVPRFVAITLRGMQLKPSPVWLQVNLARVGIRPINNIVDYTNFFMVLTGQPIHAYDYDKVKGLLDAEAEGVTLTVRHPRPGETITLLNGKTIEPRVEAMMVAAGNKLICVGGAIGGAETEVDEHTKNVIIEAATWDMYEMRRTAMAHGIFTDAVTRFTKGQSPLQNLAIIAEIVDEIRRYAGGKVASDVVDANNLSAEVMKRGSLHPSVHVSRDFINERLGWDLSAGEIKQLLQNVEFRVDVHEEELTVASPFWRTDIEIQEDVVEEVGRLYGYDRLPLELPKRDISPAPKNPMLELKGQLRQTLAAAGANEVLTYSFVHGNLLDKVGQNRQAAFQLANALSPDLQYLRLSLTPSLLDKVHANIKAGHDQFALFELGKVHLQGVEEDGLPKELSRLALVFAADQKAAASYAGAPYYQARKYLMQLLSEVGLAGRASFEPLAASDSDQATPYYQPGRAATIKLGDTIIGRLGEYKASVRRALKLPDFCAGFELGLAPLLAAGQANPYVPLPRFPSVSQDICLKVPASTPYAKVFNFVLDQLNQQRSDTMYHTLSPVDIYQRSDDPGHKQITLRLSLASYERTLTDQEVSNLLDHIATAAQTQLQAERI